MTDGESQKEYQRDNLEFDLYGAYDISEEDIQRVKDSLDSDLQVKTKKFQ